MCSDQRLTHTQAVERWWRQSHDMQLAPPTRHVTHTLPDGLHYFEQGSLVWYPHTQHKLGIRWSGRFDLQCLLIMIQVVGRGTRGTPTHQSKSVTGCVWVDGCDVRESIRQEKFIITLWTMPCKLLSSNPLKLLFFNHQHGG